MTRDEGPTKSPPSASAAHRERAELFFVRTAGIGHAERCEALAQEFESIYGEGFTDGTHEAFDVLAADQKWEN